ncbi:UDP-glycosyltransferase 84B2-like [Senna tora]|uniref:Glycosyltransferase n=1 Tax=Senna tora TaxID=362788 RepID=A0A834STU4_9FABA|nr:UDP-glycosyltransferase 84B2-like [Senna tora]
MAKGEEKSSVLMVSMAFQGHMNPMLRLAKILNSKGVRVTLATTEAVRHRMLKYNSNSTINNINSDNNPNQIELAFFSDGLSPDFDRVTYAEEFFLSLEAQGPTNLSSLIGNLSRNDFSCMIINPFMPWAIDVAHKLGIPCAILWIQASAVYSIYYRYYKSINRFPNLEDPNGIVQLPGIPSLEVRELPSFMLPSSPPFIRTMLENIFESIDKVRWVFATSFDDFEEEIVKSMDSLIPIRSIGPLVSPFMLGQKETNDLSVDMWGVDESCMGWLDEKPNSSVIYVSFGSIIVLTQNQMDNIAMALKNSNKAFLWVIQESNPSGGSLSREFLEETKGRGMVVNWCPQEKVLMHPSIGCFVTHCGWNSMIEAVVAGLPMVAYPKWSDQAINTKLCISVFENGVRVNCGEDGVARAEEVERCIREVMEGPKGVEMKKKAMKMKEDARKAIEEGGSSNRNINMFISELINNVGN